MKATPLNDLSQPDRAKIADFLDSHPIGVLATVDENGDPNASTIYFGADNNLQVSFTTKRDTRKHQNIERRNKVALVVYDAETQSAVQLSGKAIEEKDAEAAQNIYHGTLQAAKQTGEDTVPPIAKISAGPYVAYKIEIEMISMSEYGWGDGLASAMEQAAAPSEETDTKDID